VGRKRQHRSFFVGYIKTRIPIFRLRRGWGTGQDNEVGRVKKESALVHFQALFQHSDGRIQENHGCTSKGTELLNRDSSPEPPQHKNACNRTI
jgi:hypothetical protein